MLSAESLYIKVKNKAICGWVKRHAMKTCMCGTIHYYPQPYTEPSSSSSGNYLQEKTVHNPFFGGLQGIKASQNVKLKRKLAAGFQAVQSGAIEIFVFLGYVFCHWVFVAQHFETSASRVRYPTLLDQDLRKLHGSLETWTLAVWSVAYHWVIMAHVLLLFCILGVRWDWVSCYCSLKWAKCTRLDDGWVWNIGGVIKDREILKY